MLMLEIFGASIAQKVCGEVAVGKAGEVIMTFWFWVKVFPFPSS